MNLLVENEVIEEIKCGTNFGYVLKDSSLFLPTEYKVLQSQTNSRFIQCMKMLYNGRIELFYLVNAYKPLSLLLPELNPDHFVAIVGNLLAGIIDVKSNGFLSCHSIDSSFEHIYVDSNTLKVGLVYLPINKHEYSDASSFENALRTNLVHVIAGTYALSSPKTNQLSADLQNGTLSIENIYSRLCGIGKTGQGNTPFGGLNGNSSLAHGTMKLVALNAPSRFEIPITKQDFSIGKKETNDGVISFNKMISKYHCKVTTNDHQYMISDLQSTNGTFVNGVRLRPNIASPVKNGDVIRLANSDFQVVIE